MNPGYRSLPPDAGVDGQSVQDPRRTALITLLAMLAAMGPLSVDFNLPATAQMVDDLGARTAQGQLALTATLSGLGIGQLLWGPISDRFGRRRPLLVGIGVFVMASLGCAIAPTIETVVLLRAVQGVSAAAGLALGRAIIRDLYDGPALTRIYARSLIAIGFTSVLGPVLGSLLLRVLDWRGTFVAIGAIGVALGILTAVMLPETIVVSGGRGIRGLAAVRDYLTPLREHNFLVFGGVIIVGSITMFMYITSISGVLQDERGLDPVTFAVVLAVNNGAIIIGSQASAFFIRFQSPRVLIVSSVAMSAAGCLALILVGVGDGPLWAFQLALFVVTFQQGAIMPLGIALAVHGLDRSVGAAVATIGGLQYLVGSLVAGMVAGAFGVSAFAMGVSMVVTSSLALLLAVLGRRI